MIAETGAGIPPQLGVSEQVAHVLPVAQLRCSQIARQPGHAGGVTQHVADRHSLLAMGRELWPRLGDSHVVVELTALGEYVSDRCGDTLAAEAAQNRVSGLTGARRPGSAAPAATLTTGWPLCITATWTPTSAPDSINPPTVSSTWRWRSATVMRGVLPLEGHGDDFMHCL